MSADLQQRIEQARRAHEQIVVAEQERAQEARQPQEQRAAVERQIAELEAQQRAEVFEALVQQGETATAEVEARRSEMLIQFDRVFEALLGVDLAPLKAALFAFDTAATQQDRLRQQVQAVAERDVKLDAQLHPPAEREKFIAAQRSIRVHRVRRIASGRTSLESWFDQGKPKTTEALLRAVSLSLVVDKGYLEQWQMSLLARKQHRLVSRSVR